MKYNIPDTNYEKGRNGYKPEAFVIHIEQGTRQGTADWFMNPLSEVSAHAAFSKDGHIDDFVAETDTAYHAGRINQPTWTIKKNVWGNINPNYYTIGCENEGVRGDLWTEPQMATLSAYIKEQAAKFNISINRKTIVSHSEIAIDKEDMTKWCDEIVRRLTAPPPVDKEAIKRQIIGLLNQL